MRFVRFKAAALLTAGVLAVSCNRSETATEQVNDKAKEQLAERNRDQAGLEKRVADLELKWNEMQARVQEKRRAPTANLNNETGADVSAARDAVAKLKTTTPDNWWDRHEEATSQALDDIAADVRRFTNREVAVADPKPLSVGTTARVDQERAEFIDRATARLDAWAAALKDVNPKGRLETELDDTRARIAKLRDDLDRARKAEADDWWNISEKRVSEYIDRVENSIERLDNDKAR